MNTKQKILQQALQLFNENGLSNVSLREISEAMDISVGNLQYHFKKREDIVEGLFDEFLNYFKNRFRTSKPKFTLTQQPHH